MTLETREHHIRFAIAVVSQFVAYIHFYFHVAEVLNHNIFVCDFHVNLSLEHIEFLQKRKFYIKTESNLKNFKNLRG